MDRIYKPNESESGTGNWIEYKLDENETKMSEKLSYWQNIYYNTAYAAFSTCTCLF